MNDLVTPPGLGMAALRQAGRLWADQGLPARLAVIRRARRLVAAQARALAGTVKRPEADTLVAEILPLLEAARFLEREALRLLRPRRLRRGRPAWLFGVSAEIHRIPLGAVLVIAPGNYPLFLPGVQVLQALAAGNAVALKPAPGCSDSARALAALLAQAGLPEGVLHILPESTGPAAVEAGFDHIVLTGAAETGAAVLAGAAPRLTPATMELSGCDAAFILPGADLDLVARCLVYGLRLNGGATCIAPRRVFVPRDMAAALEARLVPLLPQSPAIAGPAWGRLTALANQAVQDGARRIGTPAALVLTGAEPGMALLRADVFAPWLALIPVPDMEAARRDNAQCPYALGASIFGPEPQARALAARLRVGSVCINDLIVPTADPRLPFGGFARSGFGRTRGAEGLLAMTGTRTISTRRRFRPHLAVPGAHDAGRFAAMALLLHGGWREWGRALQALARR